MLIIEALSAHTANNTQRYIEQLAVIELCETAKTVMQHYQRLHKQFPQREFYFVHTSREQLTIIERQWLGIRNNIA